MYFFTFDKNAFLISIILMINISRSRSIIAENQKLYKLISFDEQYDTYSTRGSSESTKFLELKEFNQTVHNPDFRQLPHPSLIYSYEIYMENLNLYCKTKYIPLKNINTPVPDKFVNEESEIEKCLNNFTDTEMSSYTSNKIAYLLFPRDEETDLNLFLKRRKQMIMILKQYLNDAGMANNDIFTSLSVKNDAISLKEFNQMKTRRAIPTENYLSYMLRLNLQRVYPLPKNLWLEEKVLVPLYDEYIKKETATFIEDNKPKKK